MKLFLYSGIAAQESILKLAEDTRQVLAALQSSGFNKVLQEQAVEIDWRLHDEIIASLGNDVVTRDYQINAGRIRLMRVSNRLDSDRIVAALDEHLNILNAALDRDKDRAAAGLEIHLTTAMRRALSGS
ncbi:FCD domain-containing protein [Advenella kashmirensis]